MISYLFRQDLQWIFRKKYKQLIIYLLVLFIFFLYCSFMISTDHIANYLNTLGLNFRLDKNILITVMFLIHCFAVIYIEIHLFTNDLKDGVSSFLLRTKLKKWITARTISTSIITILIKALLHIILSLITIIFFGKIITVYEIVKYFVIDCIFYILIQNIAFLFYLISYLSKITILIGVFFTIISINYIPLNAISLLNYQLYLLVILLLLQFINYIIVKNTYVKIFEEEIL